MKLNSINERFHLQKVKEYFSTEKNKIVGIIILIILLTVLIYIGIAPLQKYNELKKQVSSDSIYIQSFDSIYNSPELAFLLKEKAYKQSLLKLSEKDSIQLIVNLRDSIVGLSIKGVVIHKTHINNFKVDPLLKKLPVLVYIKLFSEPLLVKAQNATIVKEPIVVRNAPKDTAEAELNAYEPDTLIQNPAFLQIKTDYGIQIYLEQDINPTFKHKWVRFMFKSKIKTRAMGTNILHFFNCKKAEYNPIIRIKMPVDDLRAIYRALPDNAYVVLNMDTK